MDSSSSASAEALAFVDGEGGRVALAEAEAALLLELTAGLEPVTVSACPDCGSRVLAVVAFGDLLEGALAHDRAGELLELVEEAPTLHLYVADLGSACIHRRWHDPLFDEWADAFAELPPVGRLSP
jgi:hypothetical protein